MTLYRVKATFSNKTIVKLFDDIYDAIDFRDTMDANYPKYVEFKKINVWNPIVMFKLIMDENYNPLSVIPRLKAHYIMQTLAFVWSVAFGFYVSSFFLFSLSAVAHVLLILACVYTYGIFNGARKNTGFDLRPGYHSVNRTRQHMWVNGQRIALDSNDPGGEHQ